MSAMDVADISFQVGGKEYRFEPPTPRIAFQVSRTVGGLVTLQDRAERGDLDVYAAMLRMACPAAPKGEEALQAFVYENVLIIGPRVVEYAWSLQNGGAPPPTAEVVGDESAEGNAEPGEASG